MPLAQVEVGIPSAASIGDNQVTGVLGGKQGEAVVSQLHGKYYTQAVRGNVHYASTASAGSVFSVYSNAAYTGLALWNPEGSGKNLALIKCNVGMNSITATNTAGFGYAWINNTGSTLATAAVISAFTLITATRGTGICGLGGQGSSVARAGSAATLTTGLLWGRAASFGASAASAITTQLSPGLGTLTEDFDGMMIVPPNTLFALTAAVVPGLTAVATLIWEEVPAP